MTENETPASPEELLQRAPIFNRLGRRSLQKLAGLCVPRSYSAGTVIIQEGSTGLGLFVITTGSLEVYKGDGESRIVLAEIERGGILGEMSLIDDQPRSASAVAVEDTECLLITRGSFQTLVKKDPEIAWCIVPALAERLRQVQQRFIDTSYALDREEDLGPGAVPVEDRLPARQEDHAGKQQATETEGEEEELLLQVAREQYALTMASFTGAKGSLKMAETFFSALADKTELPTSSNLFDVLRELPKGMLSAAESALAEGERIPERMLSQYRKHRSRKDS